MDNLSNTFKRDTRLDSILHAPTLSQSDKQQIVGEIQKSINVQDKTNTMQNFLSTLAENNRLGVLEGVCEKFSTLMSAARGEVEMTITSAAPLDQKVVRQLEQAVSKSQYVGQGKKLKVVPKVRWLTRLICVEFHADCYATGQPRHPRRPGRRDWRPHDRPQRFGEDGEDEQAPSGHFVDM